MGRLGATRAAPGVVALTVAALVVSGAASATALSSTPRLMMSTLVGGWQNAVTATAVDGQGRIYIAGYSNNNTTWPTTPAAYQRTFRGGTDGFVARLSADGSHLDFATYLGGGGTDTITGLAVDGAGEAVVVGDTASGDFPRTANTFRPTPFGSNNAFVTKFSADGSKLVYSAMLSAGGWGADANAVAADANGNVWVTGTSTEDSVPPTPGAYASPKRGGYADTFVLKIVPSGRRLIFSSVVGGSGGDESR